MPVRFTAINLVARKLPQGFVFLQPSPAGSLADPMRVLFDLSTAPRSGFTLADNPPLLTIHLVLLYPCSRGRFLA